QQLQEGAPAGGVGLRIRVLGRVAACRIQEDRLVGEPPIAVSCTADAAHGLLAELLREREMQAGVDEHGGLARARRSDDDVPGQVVETRRALLARLLERLDRLLEPLLELRRIRRAAAGTSAAVRL